MNPNKIPEKIIGSYFVDSEGTIIRVVFFDKTNVTCMCIVENCLKSRLIATHVFFTDVMLGKVLAL